MSESTERLFVQADNPSRNGYGKTLINSLEEMIAARLAIKAPVALEPLCQAIRDRFGEAVVGILFYGSCLRQEDPLEGVVDLYVVVSE